MKKKETEEKTKNQREACAWLAESYSLFKRKNGKLKAYFNENSMGCYRGTR